MVLGQLRKALGSCRLLLYECRKCGTTLEEEAEERPFCGGKENAYYGL